MTTLPTRQQIEDAPALGFEKELDPIYYYPQITMSAAVQHRGRTITVHAADMTADQFCDILDKRFGPPTANPAPAATATAPTGEAPVCPIHTDRRMKPSNYGGWFCTATNLTTGEKCKERVK